MRNRWMRQAVKESSQLYGIGSRKEIGKTVPVLLSCRVRINAVEGPFLEDACIVLLSLGMVVRAGSTVWEAALLSIATPLCSYNPWCAIITSSYSR